MKVVEEKLELTPDWLATGLDIIPDTLCISSDLCPSGITWKRGSKAGGLMRKFDFWHVTKNSKLEENEPLLWNYVYIRRANKTQNQKFHMSKNPQRTDCAVEAFRVKDSSREHCGPFSRRLNLFHFNL